MYRGAFWLPPLSCPPHRMDRLTLADYRLGRALIDTMRAASQRKG